MHTLRSGPEGTHTKEKKAKEESRKNREPHWKEDAIEIPYSSVAKGTSVKSRKDIEETKKNCNTKGGAVWEKKKTIKSGNEKGLGNPK